MKDKKFHLIVFGCQMNISDAERLVYLDVDAQSGLDRIGDRHFLDRLDREAVEFHQRVVDGYRLVRERFKDRIVVVDANREVSAVQQDALTVVLRAVNAHD